MDWIYTTLAWYFYLFTIGLVFLPVTKKIFGRFSMDFGYPFAKVLAIIFVSYLSYVLGTLKLVSFTRGSLFLMIGIFALINWLILNRHSGKRASDNERVRPESKLDSGVVHSPSARSLPRITIIVFEEILFLACLLFWAFVRSQEPSIRSLEKFMDFGFINSILRADFFPPKDIWYSPEPINYYYFGHLTGAMLIKISNIKPAIGYNLILATIFALGMTQVFSFVGNIVETLKNSGEPFGSAQGKRGDRQGKKHLRGEAMNSPRSHLGGESLATRMTSISTIILGLLGAIVVNLGGNLHTIYLFTKGYPNESPIPFWTILSKYNPTAYWYPNATRFIPDTIHEFPSYSYVVADLHGHVFDIPFVLLTLAILFLFFINSSNQEVISHNKIFNFQFSIFKQLSNFKFLISKLFSSHQQLVATIFLGFLTAIHYMTNAFDGPIYILLISVILFYLFRFSWSFLFYFFILISSFVIFSLPFSWHFKPFVNGIGVNCSPTFLTNLGKLGPFLFEKGNCQISPFWMLFVLWGFFWISFILFLIINRFKNNPLNAYHLTLNRFFLILFSFGTFLIIIPEFFYIKDIYPQHFRANTMFKLGYQAFIMMGIASVVTFYLIKNFVSLSLRPLRLRLASLGIMWLWMLSFFLIAIYSFYAVPSYYGQMDRKPDLDGASWLLNEPPDGYPEDMEIIDYLNKNEKGQPTILEAQGDSYTDYERISAFTGLPTVAGWWVHEWLWRGSADVVGNRIPDVENLYKSKDIEETRSLINKYRIKYVIVSRLERQKYPDLDEEKFKKIGQLLLKSDNGFGALYQVIPQ